MPVFTGKPTRKTIIRGDRSIAFDTHETAVVTDSFYATNGEELIIVKDVNQSKIKLNSLTTEIVTIKTLTSLTIIPDIGRIDEDWDEISLSRGACINFRFVSGTWYILSSDGIKLD
jgi:hypothetical protein